VADTRKRFTKRVNTGPTRKRHAAGG
jgi:hypothetical protein